MAKEQNTARGLERSTKEATKAVKEKSGHDLEYVIFTDETTVQIETQRHTYMLPSLVNAGA